MKNPAAYYWDWLGSVYVGDICIELIGDVTENGKAMLAYNFPRVGKGRELYSQVACLENPTFALQQLKTKPRKGFLLLLFR